MADKIKAFFKQKKAEAKFKVGTADVVMLEICVVEVREAFSKKYVA